MHTEEHESTGKHAYARQTHSNGLGWHVVVHARVGRATRDRLFILLALFLHHQTATHAAAIARQHKKSPQHYNTHTHTYSVGFAR
jgi:hypothetical protein